MKTTFIIFGILSLLLITLGILSFIFVEIPKQSEIINLKNISIISVNDKTLLSENYYIFNLGNLINSGKTLSGGYIKENLNFNNTYYIFSDGNDIFYNNNLNSEVKINVNKINNVSVNINGELGIDNPINLTLISDNNINNRLLCFKWSFNILNVEIENFTLKTSPNRIKADRCYEINGNSNNITIPIKYKKFLALKNDSIEVILVFGDRNLFDNREFYDRLNNLVYEINGTYVKIPDLSLKINNNNIYNN